MKIHGVFDGFERLWRGQIKVSLLGQGVNARIRAPGAPQPDSLAGQFLKRFFQGLLDGHARDLPLPTDEPAAVIFNCDAIAMHD